MATQTKEELDRLDREWYEKTEILYDKVALLLLAGNVGVINGWPRAMSQFGTPYETFTESHFDRDEARAACLAHFQKIADRHDYVRQKAGMVPAGEEPVVYDNYGETPAILVFRRSPYLAPPRRELEPGTGFEFDVPERFTGRVIHAWSARYHLINMKKFMEWWHPIVFSHEPGRRHGG